MNFIEIIALVCSVVLIVGVITAVAAMLYFQSEQEELTR